jgi:hypothetical protein
MKYKNRHIRRLWLKLVRKVKRYQVFQFSELEGLSLLPFTMTSEKKSLSDVGIVNKTPWITTFSERLLINGVEDIEPGVLYISTSDVPLHPVFTFKHTYAQSKMDPSLLKEWCNALELSGFILNARDVKSPLQDIVVKTIRVSADRITFLTRTRLGTNCSLVSREHALISMRRLDRDWETREFQGIAPLL